MNQGLLHMSSILVPLASDGQEGGQERKALGLTKVSWREDASTSCKIKIM